ncbi:hypothetical protein K432DRAFT_318126 [Lepidopterella palustris CBS 459.81]|uniref:DNA repair protein Dds20/Sfr1 n=1 Tax=Lepidopterella palustris CBS 459.81 TaxID=1314670 RepID=A0A8E2JKC0_9PEZI|nr:hypothetical protein K432DRAFT_318126 [Lepidopterella palustris CBS 459.81]
MSKVTDSVMSTPAAKRRRLDNATSALHKPFKSPFRTPLKPAQDGGTGITDTKTPSATPTPNLLQPSSKIEDLRPATQQEPPTKPLRPATTPMRPKQPLANATLASSTKKTTPSLNHRLISLRTDIQTLTQAHALATTSTDADLEVLIERWRAASRAAAEEIFASTRDRVNRMGGVGAWREREREQRDWRRRMEMEEMEAERERLERRDDGDEEDGEGGEGEKREYWAEAEAEVERDYERETEKEGEERVEDGADDDSFTMDMMLKTLNIDVNIIGYDKVNQRWIG